MSDENREWHTYRAWEWKANFPVSSDEAILTQWREMPDKRRMASVLRQIGAWQKLVSNSRHDLYALPEPACSSRSDTLRRERILKALPRRSAELEKRLRRLYTIQTSVLFSKYTTERSRQYTKSLIDIVLHNVRQDGNSGLPAVESLFKDFDELPPVLQDYISDGIDDIRSRHVEISITEQEVVDHLSEEIAYVREYGDISTHDWMTETPIQSRIQQKSDHLRTAGCVQCLGHPPREMGYRQNNRARLKRSWENFGDEHTKLPQSVKATEDWIVQAAILRALLVFDHTGLEVQPPQDSQDVQAFGQVLDHLSDVEAQFYRRASVLPDTLEVLVDRYLRAHGDLLAENPNMPLPPLPPPSYTPKSETIIDVHAGSRRAMCHQSEHAIREMMIENRSTQDVVDATSAYYQRLVDFEAVDLPNHRRFKALEKTRHGVAASLSPDKILDPEASGGWVMVGPIGLGTSSFGYLWVRYDEKEGIVERIVSKDTYFTQTQWDDAGQWRWHNGVEFPKEAFINTVFCQPYAENNTIVRLYGSYISRTHRLTRMYLEYCAYGNLAELCERYEQDLVNPLPERLLWNLFECLALVCLALKSASRTNNSMEVVHQNITPWNILLADKNGADWPGQPTFKLSGFGSAEETSSQDPGNPQQIRAPGTFGYVAPEQDADKGGHRILGEHTNIWACGNLMQKTMAQSGSHVAYSQALRSLVAECVRDQEKMRPTAKQLLNRIRAQVSHGSFERGFFSRIKNFLSKFWRHFIHEELATTPYKFQRAQPHENHHFLPDKYRLGTARDVDDEADISHLGTITVPDSDDDSDGNDQGSRICQVPLSDR